MTANMGNFSAMLRSSEDWEAFWFALEGMAGSSENSVFKFVDVYDKANLLSAPELPKIPEAPELPRRPVVTESVNDSQANQLHTLLLTEHRYRHAAYVDEKTRVSKQWERYDALSGWVRQHVHPDNYVYMRNEKTLFRQLLALKSQFAPTDRARELLITRTYNEARTYRDNQPVIRWQRQLDIELIMILYMPSKSLTENTLNIFRYNLKRKGKKIKFLLWLK